MRWIQNLYDKKINLAGINNFFMIIIMNHGQLPVYHTNTKGVEIIRIHGSILYNYYTRL